MSNLALKLETIQFHTQSLIVINHQNKLYVAMKPICENIGLDWHAQRQRINRHQVLSKGAVMITSPSKGGEQEYVCLPISMINGWLFGIETNRVKPEIRSTLEQYQLECFDVLYNYFMPKVAQQYPNTINEEQQYLISKAVDERVHRTGEKHQTVYHKFYDHFKITSYKNLPSSKFNAAIEFLGGFHQNKLPITEQNLKALISHAIWIYNFYRENKIIEIFRMLNSDFGAKMVNHIESCYTLSNGLKTELERHHNQLPNKALTK